MTDRPEGEAGRCMRPVRLPRWTRQRRDIFLATLAETSNVSAAARAAGMDRSSAYALKGRNAAFAQAWEAALERGYSELELDLLRQARGGTVRTEKVIDAATEEVRQIRTIHSYPLTIAMRLLLAHRAEVAAYRSENGDVGTRESEVAAIMADMDRVRARLLGGDEVAGEEMGGGGRGIGDGGGDEDEDSADADFDSDE